MNKNIVVVGGGLAGLAASIFLARAGRTVTLFERRRNLGGRAVTHLRHGYRFNLGAHSVFRTGPGASVYRELGIPVRGGRPKPVGVALIDGEEHRLPLSFLSLFGSSLLSMKAKMAAASLMWRIRRLDPSRFATMTIGEWLDANVTDARLHQLMLALVRLATYADHPQTQSAPVALAQLKLLMKGSIYVDEGWQKLVDSMHSAAVAAGVNFVTSSRIVRIVHDGSAVRAVEMGGLEVDADRMDTQSVAMPLMQPEDVQGAKLPVDAVVLAVDPVSACQLVGDETITRNWCAAQPVTAACLDVALKTLPNPKRPFALAIDRPHALAVHSVYSHLTPHGGALIHVAKYRKDQNRTAVEYDEHRTRRIEANGDETELESVLDRVQPGWRDVLVHRRFLPSMTVSNALVTPSTQRPAPVTPVRGLYIAGDWVGNEGLLSDAALASARTAAKAILA